MEMAQKKTSSSYTQLDKKSARKVSGLSCPLTPPFHARSQVLPVPLLHRTTALQMSDVQGLAIGPVHVKPQLSVEGHVHCDLRKVGLVEEC